MMDCRAVAEVTFTLEKEYNGVENEEEADMIMSREELEELLYQETVKNFNVEVTEVLVTKTWEEEKEEGEDD